MAHILLQKNVSSFCKKAFLSPLTSYLLPLTSKKPLLVRA